MIEKWCVRFLLPLKYNNGHDIESYKFDQVRMDLLKRFGGFTIHSSPLEGEWIDPGENIKYSDRTKLWEITIDKTEKNKEFIKKYKEELKKIFKQHEIYMFVTTVSKI